MTALLPWRLRLTLRLHSAAEHLRMKSPRLPPSWRGAPLTPGLHLAFGRAPGPAGRILQRELRLPEGGGALFLHDGILQPPPRLRPHTASTLSFCASLEDLPAALAVAACQGELNLIIVALEAAPAPQPERARLAQALGEILDHAASLTVILLAIGEAPLRDSLTRDLRSRAQRL